ncbi:cation diffusion facilitator family transporter [Anditalea andensis]|uniref:Cation diffusion facilitator family transporter n=1 Tax=Anditalea andensis TaxID=1048983 RepID=A0A074KV62_9BACT|nr:cation diffusion facilitator family transporter [Anditalea andensis]KEO73876.1 cation diffusion facilitator family transporter [Anditalea andensis]
MQNKKRNWIVASFIISVVLLILKFYSYYITNSTAILTDALESIVNVVASGFAFYSIYLSSIPKDTNHPYGHGKIEFFSAGIEGVLIILAGIFIIYQSVYNFFFIEDLDSLPIGIVIIAFSGIINGLLGYFLIKNGRELNSLTLEADGKHIMTDAFSSAVLVIGVSIIYFTGYYILDSFFSLVFAIYIIYTGYFLVRKSVAGLMDEADPLAMDAVVYTLKKHRKNNWIDIHNMRVQQYGTDRHIDLHLTLPYYFDLKMVHDEVESVENVLEDEMRGYVEVFVHADPCVPSQCCHYCQVENCAVRQEPLQKKITWDIINLTKNQKHYHEYSKK